MVQEMIQGASIVAQNVSVSDSVAVAFDHDDTSGNQNSGGLIDRVAPAFDAKIGWYRAQHVKHLVDPILQILSKHGWSQGRR